MLVARSRATGSALLAIAQPFVQRIAAILSASASNADIACIAGRESGLLASSTSFGFEAHTLGGWIRATAFTVGSVVCCVTCIPCERNSQPMVGRVGTANSEELHSDTSEIAMMSEAAMQK